MGHAQLWAAGKGRDGNALCGVSGECGEEPGCQYLPLYRTKSGHDILYFFPAVQHFVLEWCHLWESSGSDDGRVSVYCGQTASLWECAGLLFSESGVDCNGFE